MSTLFPYTTLFRSDPAGELVRDLGEVGDQDDLLEDLAHPQEFLDEELPRDLRVEGTEVSFVDEQRLHPTEGAADLRHRREFPGDREAQGRVDLRLLAAAELGHVMPLPIDALDQDADPMAPSFFVRLQADSPEPAVGELGEVLRRLDLEFGEELIDGVHDDATLVEDAIHEDVVDLEFPTERLSLAFRLLQFLRVRFEGHNLFLQRLRLSLEEMPRLPFGVEFALEGLEPRLRGDEYVLRGPEPREVRLESRPLRLERLSLQFQIGESSAHVANLAQEDREFIEPLSLRRLFEDRLTDHLQALLVLFREGHGVELPQRLDLCIVERLNEAVAVVRLLTKVVLQLLQLSLVFRENKRILIDRGDLLVDSSEGLLRAGLFLAQSIQIICLLLQEGPFGLELRGDLPLVSDLCHAGLESLEPCRAVLESRGRLHPAFVFRLEVLHLLRMEFEVRLELRHTASADLAFLVQASQLLLQTGKATQRFLAGGDLCFFRLDVGLQGRESFLRPLERLFEDL